MKRSFLPNALLLTTVALNFFCINLHSQDSEDYKETYKNYFPDFTITSPAFYYLPGDTVKINLYTPGIKTTSVFTVKVYRILNPEQFIISQPNRNTFSVVGKDSSNLLSLLEEKDTFTKKIHPKKKKNTFDVIKHIPKQKGAYLVRIYLRNKVATCGFFVTELALITRFAQSSVLNYTANRITSEPVDSVSLSLYLNNQKIGNALTSGASNNYLLSSIDKETIFKLGNIHPLIIAIKNNEVAVSDPYFYFYGGNQTRFTAYIVTSQPVYRPPAKIDFKISVRELASSGYTVYANKDIIVHVKDSKKSSIYRKLANTDEFGSFSDSINIEGDAALGDYKIIAEIIEQTDSTDSDKMIYQSFEQVFGVEEYKKPEYKVEIKTDKEQYSNKEKIEIEVQSDYYFGSPVQDAEVHYNIFKKPLYRPWWYYSEYRWFYESYYSTLGNQPNYYNSVNIYQGNGKLDENGYFKASYKINEDFKEESGNYSYETDYTYIINVYVKDKSRRNILSTKSVNVTRSDYFINAQTDRYVCRPGEKIGLTVRARDFSDKPVEAGFTVSINRISYEKKVKVTNFIGTAYGKTSLTGDAALFLDTEPEGYYEIEVTSFDSKNTKITDKKGTYVFSGDFSWWNRQAGTIEIIPEKDSYKPGETARIFTALAHNDVSILITNYNKNIVSYRVEKVSGNTAFIEIPVTENSAPNFYFNISYVKNGNYYSNSRSIAVIPVVKFLNVELSSDKPVYKPRDEGTISITVRDKFGNPVKNSEVTLGMIDESIYAIKPENIPDIRSAFYSPAGDNTAVTFNHNNVYRYNIGSTYLSLFEMYDFKTFPTEKLCKVTGKLYNSRGAPIEYGIILVNDAYYASVSNKNGEFEFIIPEGNYKISVVFGWEQIEGHIDIKTERYKSNFIEIKCGLSGIFSAIYNYEDIEVKDRDFVNIKPVTDTIEVVEKRSVLSPDQSGKIIGTEFLVIDNTGIRGIENITAKTSGIITDEEGNIINIRGGRTYETAIEERTEKEDYIEAIPRTDFRDAILWLPAVYTDENGNAQVKVKFPDNLTTWRVTARVITKNTEVGQNTYSVIERKDLIIRVEVPRFFQQNDEVTVSTIIHNYLNEDKKTKVSLRLDNLMLAASSPYEKEILLGKNEERRIDWKVKVLNPVGVGNVYASALTNEESDAMEQFIPIQPFGLKVNKYNAYDFSKTSGIITKTIEIPEHTDTRSASLKLGVSPSLASSLLGSLEYLIGYPYGCIEQTMSRFMPTVIAANTLKEINAPEDPYFKQQIPKMVKNGFQKIFSMQKNDGGWGWWTNDGSDPYMSAYVLYSLTLAKENGYNFKDYNIKEKDYKNAVNFAVKSLKNKKLDLATRAFITYVISNISVSDTALALVAAKQFKKFERKETSSLVKAWLSMAAGKLGREETQRKYISDVMREVNFTDEGGAYWGGKIKRYKWQDDYIITTSMVIKGLLADAQSASENKDYIEKAVNWLLTQKRGNSWGNTLQNAFIVYCLSDYIKKYNELEPDYTLKIYVNNKPAAEKHITKDDVFRKEERFFVTGDMLKSGENKITIEKSGAGKTYLTTALTYYEYDTRKTIEETVNGFDIERKYFTLKKVYSKKKGIYTYKKREYKGVIKSGEELLVKIKVYPNENSGAYFMLEEPIPAGCEYIKEDWAYAIDGENSYNGKSTGLWNWWYADKELRDNRIVFFAPYLGSGEYEFSYLLRAQIPGIYNIMPSRGMLMYYPEVNGSSDNSTLRIEE
ncbi:MAG: MG2 domain-containing protein [Chlorobi bacterium]|nr:MG2 domain-containing protein [Chlorobiota bacterium]MCI0715886.1 MG2 domain-containing protein [Chlorobiota bacterium]